MIDRQTGIARTGQSRILYIDQRTGKVFTAVAGQSNRTPRNGTAVQRQMRILGYAGCNSLVKGHAARKDNASAVFRSRRDARQLCICMIEIDRCGRSGTLRHAVSISDGYVRIGHREIGICHR